jgi:hypothetical protein
MAWSTAPVDPRDPSVTDVEPSNVSVPAFVGETAAALNGSAPNHGPLVW